MPRTTTCLRSAPVPKRIIERENLEFSSDPPVCVGGNQTDKKFQDCCGPNIVCHTQRNEEQESLNNEEDAYVHIVKRLSGGLE